jgi:hypothetical protein
MVFLLGLPGWMPWIYQVVILVSPVQTPWNFHHISLEGPGKDIGGTKHRTWEDQVKEGTNSGV